MGRIPVCRRPFAGLLVGVLMASVSSLSDCIIVVSASAVSLSSCVPSCFASASALAAENELMYVVRAADVGVTVCFDSTSVSREFVTDPEAATEGRVGLDLDFAENFVSDERRFVVELSVTASLPATSVNVLPPHESLLSLVTSTKSDADALLAPPGDGSEAITVVDSDGSVESEDPEMVLVSGLASGAREDGDKLGSCELVSVVSGLLS